MILGDLLSKLMHDAFIESTERLSNNNHELYQALSVVWTNISPDLLWADIEDIMEDKHKQGRIGMNHMIAYMKKLLFLSAAVMICLCAVIYESQPVSASLSSVEESEITEFIKLFDKFIPCSTIKRY